MDGKNELSEEPSTPHRMMGAKGERRREVLTSAEEFLALRWHSMASSGMTSPPRRALVPPRPDVISCRRRRRRRRLDDDEDRGGVGLVCRIDATLPQPEMLQAFRRAVQSEVR